MKRTMLPSFSNRVLVIIFVTCTSGVFQKTSAQEIFSLPFNEGWTSGNFSLNQWQVGQNWRLHGQMGTPLPAVEFHWDPILENYSSSLESRSFKTKTGNGTSERSIWLGFNITLKDRISSGDEKLIVEVWNGKQWSKVADFLNKGSFNWVTKLIDITQSINNNEFKIKFTAIGKSSKDISFWMIDNINLFYDDHTFVFKKSPIGPIKTEKQSTSSRSSEIALSENSFIDNSISFSKRNLVGYNVYRREYLDPIIGSGFTILSDWHLLNNSPVNATEYWDNNLLNNCYDYYVTAVYSEGESVPSNIDDWNCIGIWEIDETDSDLIRIYPNPATTYVEIEFPSNIVQLSIYSALGSTLLHKEFIGESHLTIQTSEFPSGTYFIKLSDSSGNVFIRKFLVIR